jgi:hypothetical protein
MESIGEPAMQIDHLQYLLSFDDPGATDDHLAKGVTVGDIRMWFDEMTQLRDAMKRANQILTVPAAEYVPAIPEAWDVLNRALRIYPNGAPMFAADGMMLNPDGSRSIFDDVDQ